MVTIVLLFLRENARFQETDITREALVISNKELDSRIILDFKIRVKDCPCYLLSAEVENIISIGELEVSQYINKTRMSTYGTPLTSEPDPTKMPRDEAAKYFATKMKTSEDCLFEGKVPVLKVPGNIHLSTHGNAELANLYYQHSKRKPTLSHTVESLLFKQYQQGYSEIMELRRLLLLQFFVNEPYIFDRMRALDKEMYADNKQRMDTNYFVKVVPYIFANAISDEEHWAYSYSLNH